MKVNLRIGIGAKLFMAIFATCMLVLITMHWGGVSVSNTASLITLSAATGSA